MVRNYLLTVSKTKRYIKCAISSKTWNTITIIHGTRNRRWSFEYVRQTNSYYLLFGSKIIWISTIRLFRWMFCVFIWIQYKRQLIDEHHRHRDQTNPHYGHIPISDFQFTNPNPNPNQLFIHSDFILPICIRPL